MNCLYCKCKSKTELCKWCVRYELNIKENCVQCGKDIIKDLKSFLVRGNYCERCNAKDWMNKKLISDLTAIFK